MKYAAKKPKKSWKEKLRIFLLVLCSVVFLVSASMLVYYLLWEPYQHNQKSSEIQMIYPTRGVDETSSQEEVNSEGTLSKFDELRSVNPDIKGWITVPNTPIDYPVLQSPQGEDPEFYLYRDYQKNDDRYGSIFMDVSCINGVNSKNVILHGHNMNDGSQFAALLNYGNLEFYQQNPVIIYDDIYRNGTWKVFAVIKVNTLASQGTPFPYLQGEFASDESFLEYVEQVRDRSLIDCPVDVEAGDQILTLSTCSYEQEDYRTAVFARRVREGESNAVDIAKATVNPDPVMPGDN